MYECMYVYMYVYTYIYIYIYIHVYIYIYIHIHTYTYIHTNAFRPLLPRGTGLLRRRGVQARGRRGSALEAAPPFLFAVIRLERHSTDLWEDKHTTTNFQHGLMVLFVSGIGSPRRLSQFTFGVSGIGSPHRLSKFTSVISGTYYSECSLAQTSLTCTRQQRVSRNLYAHTAHVPACVRAPNETGQSFAPLFIIAGGSPESPAQA